jgi:hypothetical protein
MACLPSGVRLSESASVYRWAVLKFAGEDTNIPVEWNPEDLHGKADYYLADHQSPTSKYKACIRIREMHKTGRNAGKYLNFEELWSCAAFELINVGRTREFEAVEKMIFRLNREEWIMRNAEIEYRTAKDLAQLYRNVWEPFAGQMGFDTDKSLWELELPDNFERSIAKFADTSYYPWDYWGRLYDVMRDSR